MAENDPITDLEGGPDQPHKPADDKEEVYFHGSPLIRGEFGRMVTAALLTALLIAVPILIHLYLPRYWVWWLYPLFWALAIIPFAVLVLYTRSIRYRISNYRIDFERGVFSKSIDTLELWHVNDVRFHQSLVDRIFNVGDITIESDDRSTPRLNLNGVPNPRPLFESLKQRIIAVKRQRGVIKMDTGG